MDEPQSVGGADTSPLLAALRRLYAQAQPGAEPHDLALLGSGFETDVYAFDLDEGGATHALVLRLYHGRGSEDKALREAGAMRRLHAAGYLVPLVALVAADGVCLGRPAIVIERIDGESLERPYWSGDPARRSEAVELHGSLMARLHSLEAATILPFSSLAGAGSPFAWIDQERCTLGGMLEDLAGFAPRGLTRALTWIDQHRGGMDCGRLAAIHGDFHRNNILVAPDGRAVVIDWSNVRIADPRADLAWTRLIAMADRWRDDARALLLAYESDTGHGVTGIELFEAAAAVRLLASVLLSLRFGAERQGMKRDAVALMRRDADHTRYVAGILQDRTGLRMPDLDDALEAAFG